MVKRIIWSIVTVFGLAAAVFTFKKVKDDAKIGIEAFRPQTVVPDGADAGN